MKLTLIIAICIVLLAIISTSMATDDIILFYTSENPVNSEYIRPLAGYINTGDTPVDWMFDGIIIYNISLYQERDPTQSTCDEYINDLFSSGQINTIDTIVGDLKDTFSQPDYKWNVVLTAPYAEGMSDGNVTENCQAIIDEWNLLNPSNLNLVGFYWGYSEAISNGDIENATKNTSDFLHTNNLNHFWIPYYNASGISNWVDYGFDYVTEQPNYALRTTAPSYYQIIGRDAYDKRLLLSSGSSGNIFIQMVSSHITSGEPVTWEEWHHIAYTSNDTTSYIYINGSEVSSGDGGADFSSSERVLIGGSVENAYPFNGTIDEVKIYSKVLSPEEILIDYGGGEVTGDIAGLWHFDEGSGTTVMDSSGNGNNGSIYGANWTTGKIGSAIYFNGTNDYVEIPDDSSLDITGNITIIAWINETKTFPDPNRFNVVNQSIINYNLAGMEFEFCNPRNGLSVDQNANDYLDYAETHNWQENILNTYYHGGCISDFSRNGHRPLYDRIYEFGYQSGGTDNISGYINSTNANPIEDAVVYVANASTHNYLAEVNTSADGHYNFTNISTGKYYIFAKEWNVSSDKSSNITVTANITTWCNLTLHREEDNIAVGKNISIDLSSSFDHEGDTLTYSCNRTDLFTDFRTTTGKGNWTNVLEGLYPVKFGTSDGVGYSNKTVIFDVSINEIITGANEWILFRNGTAYNLTFEQMVANESNITACSHYNYSSGLWEPYWVGYDINNNTLINNHESVMCFFDAVTTISCDIAAAENVVIPANVWFYSYLRESTSYNITTINASITSDGCVISAIYGHQNNTGLYNNTGSYPVDPNKGIVIYATTGCTWDGSV